MRIRTIRSGMGGALFALLVTALACSAGAAWASPLSSQARARLGAGQPSFVVVEFDAAATDRAAVAERTRRHLSRDDDAILTMRSQGYAATKSSVTAGVAGPDAVRVRDYQHFPLALWRISSLAALSRLEAYPGVRAVHQNTLLRPVSVSDLPFINQPQAAAAGATGAGTTIAVIDGGLGTNYRNFSDFGTCTAVGTPAATCRVVVSDDFYTGAQASTETVHGTNVSAIALGVAPGARLAMFDVFQGAGASSADIIKALDMIVSDRTTYNIVAVNMSVGDGTSNSAQCAGSVFASALANTSNAGIVNVAAAGNSGSKTGLGDPACVPGVVSVGAVYDASYGTVTWEAAADTGGECSDATAADHVTCFSQSASYLSILGPGSFVNAPSAAFQQSGTSQATPHIAGSVAVLRARYPAESLSETVQRLQVSGVSDTDSANGRVTPRVNLAAAVSQGTSLGLSGSGPSIGVSGQAGVYSITVTNSGPLAATDVSVLDSLPTGATFKSGSGGCAVASGGVGVKCTIGTLAVGASVTVTITVTFGATGAVYDSASVTADQVNSAAQQGVAFGTPPSQGGDGPLPLWAYALLGVILFGMASRKLRDGAIGAG